MKQANFNEIFNEIYAKDGQQLEKMRKSVITKMIIFILISIFLLIALFKVMSQGNFLMFYGFLAVLFILIAIIVYVSKINSNYNKKFKFI